MPDLPPTLRICYVLSHFSPVESGAERQALAQGRELVRRGHSVHVVTQSVPGVPRDEVVQGLVVHRRVVPLEIGPLFALSFVAGVIRTLGQLRQEYDLIHTHQGLWEAVATGLGRPLFRGVPTLVQPASSGYFGEAEELARTHGFPVLRRLIARNTAFAAISRDIEDQWRALGIPADRIIRTASGVDADHFRAGPEAEGSNLLPHPRVVFTGRLHPQKNLDLLIDCWPAVAARTPASLILVGQGPEHARLEARVRALGMEGRVQFLGAVEDAAGILRAADLFVLPSVAEGMSNSLLEAMATGLPCLASNIGGNIDLLGGGTGRLLATDRPADWSATIVEVLTQPGLGAQLGAAARERIERTYALPVVVDRYLSIYRELLDARTPPRPSTSSGGEA